MTIRPLVETDLPALLALCREALPLDVFSVPLLHDRMLGEPGHRPHLQLGAWEGDRLLGAMLGGVRGEGAEAVAALRLFAVAHDRRREGVATALLAETEARVRAEGVARLTVGDSAPIYFWPGLDVRYTPAYCFLERRGFTRTQDSAINMEVDLRSRDWDTAEEERRLAADGFVMRRAAPEDREAFAAWLHSEWNATWEYETVRAYENDPVSAWVVTHEGRIRAFAAYNGTGFANGFGPTGTEEALRGKGLGRALFLACMRDLRAQGYATCEVCWVGPISFYARVADARITRVFWFLEKRL